MRDGRVAPQPSGRLGDPALRPAVSRYDRREWRLMWTGATGLEPATSGVTDLIPAEGLGKICAYLSQFEAGKSTSNRLVGTHSGTHGIGPVISGIANRP